MLIAPLESPQLQLTLIPVERTAEELIPLALRCRPELTYREAQVQACASSSAAGGAIGPSCPSFSPAAPAARFPIPWRSALSAPAPEERFPTSTSASDFDLQAIWQLNNLGLGNQALIEQRVEERELAQIESCKVRDIVVKEVTQGWADLHSASRRSVHAERELQQALISAKKNVEALGQTKRVAGNIRILVIRPLEAVVALQALNEAYYHYFGAVADYNRAQFELYPALGSPAQALGGRPRAADPAGARWVSAGPVAGGSRGTPPLPPATAVGLTDPRPSEPRP